MRDPKFLIREGYLEKVEDFDHEGKKILASRLGYRITDRFVRAFLGRIFSNPGAVFSEEMLRPESQGIDVFVEGVTAIIDTQRRVAEHYFSDGSVEAACPPLKTLLHIMAHGHYNGKDVHDEGVRSLFNRENVLKSDWYRERLLTQQSRDVSLWTRHVKSLEKAISLPTPSEARTKLNLMDRLAYARKQLHNAQSEKFPNSLIGTLGADPLV
jgi:hypothetical protein